MKKGIFSVLILLIVLVSIMPAETTLREGKTGISAHLVAGKNDGDDVGHVGLGGEYGVNSHLSLGAGYVYVDGKWPLADHALELYARGYLFDRPLDLYAHIGTQICFSDEIDTLYTFSGGLEWQSSFGLFIGLEGGPVLESSSWGYLLGARVGYRF